MSKPYEVVTLLRDFRAQTPFRGIMCVSLAYAAFPTRASHVNIARQRRKCIRIRRWDFENAIVPRRYPRDEIGNAHGGTHSLPKDSLKSGFPQGRRDLFSSKLLITLHKPDLMYLELFFIFISESSRVAQMLLSSAIDKFIHFLYNNLITYASVFLSGLVSW